MSNRGLEVPNVSPTLNAESGPVPHHRRGWWWKALLVGIVLWILSAITTALTANANLIPTVILIGSFLVPFTAVLYAIERVAPTTNILQILLAFILGGVCGVLAASLLEANLRPSSFIYIGVGLIEEFVKGIILLVIAWRITPKTANQGALFGATVGAGFAAFESAGYAFNSALTVQGINLMSLLQTEVLRAVLTPVGHVLWTAILGAVIFGVATGRSRFRWSLFIPLAYLAISLLHAFWDSLGNIAAVLALLLTGGAFQQLAYAGFLLPGTAAAVRALSTAFYAIGVIVAAAIGILTLVLILRHYRRRHPDDQDGAGLGRSGDHRTRR